MYQNRVFGNIVVAVFSGDVSLANVEAFGKDIEELSQTIDDLYIIGLPLNVTQYPTNLGEMLKSLNLLQSSINSVKRMYGIKINPFLSFLANTATQVLRIKSNTVEAATIDDLYTIMEKEATLFPMLQASLVHIDDIKAYIASFETGTES